MLQEFEITDKKKKVKVAGCRCIKGNLRKDGLYRLIRGQDTIYAGKTQFFIKNVVTNKRYYFFFVFILQEN